jgi:peptidylprolyl isomerase
MGPNLIDAVDIATAGPAPLALRRLRWHDAAMKLLISVAALALQAANAQAQAPAAPGPSDILAAAPAGDWQAIEPANLLLLEFAGGRRVVVQLANAFAPGHVANIHALVRAGWFPRHAAIVRVQENYVVQWGDPTGKAPLPADVEPSPPGSYERPGPPVGFVALPFPDAYGAKVGHALGWAVATDGKTHWLPHCPGMVGAGRDMPPDTGSGAELYAVIGHGPRHLDRNIAVVGRVLEGMEALSALPRGTGPLGFYEDPAKRVALLSARLGSDLPAAEQPRFQVLRSDSASMARWVEARASRRDAFFVRPAGSADICNLLPPVRRAG